MCLKKNCGSITVIENWLSMQVMGKQLRQRRLIWPNPRRRRTGSSRSLRFRQAFVAASLGIWRCCAARPLQGCMFQNHSFSHSAPLNVCWQQARTSRLQLNWTSCFQPWYSPSSLYWWNRVLEHHESTIENPCLPNAETFIAPCPQAGFLYKPDRRCR